MAERLRARPRVVIMGGGVGGMSAAHELVTRGFEVVVLEKGRIPGGKARSVPVSDEGPTRSGHVLEDTGVASLEHKLPGEHGFRFFPGFYKHVVDTMRRIPSLDGRPVADHLVSTTRIQVTQYGRPSFEVPATFPRTPADAGTILRDLLVAFSPITELTPDDLAHFGGKVWQILTSCAERRLGEYEGTDWWSFVGAAERSPAYRKFLATGITRSLVAAKAHRASTRTIGDIFVQLLLTMLNPAEPSTDRVLDGPTNLVWMDPWRAHLERLGVRYLIGAEVQQIHCHAGRVTGVTALIDGTPTRVEGDHYVCAVPIERAAPLMNADLCAADPRLAQLAQLSPNVEWMTGVQYYLKRDIPSPHGHVIHIDTEWALTSIAQLQFWRTMGPADLGSSGVRGVLSVDVSDWTAPSRSGKPAMECTRREVARETWEQLKRSMNVESEILRDEDIHSWYLDSDVYADPQRPGYLHNAEPLLVNLTDTWKLRPDATTAIPNFFLASDYVRTYTDLATMEGANEAARRAVNGILAASGHPGAPCELWPLHEPEVLAPWRAYDAARFQAGQPWDDGLLRVASDAIRGVSPVLDVAASLIPQSAPVVEPVASVLEWPESVVSAPDVMRMIDPGVAPASTYQVAAPYRVLEAAQQQPAIGALIGPAGFLQRLGWYRDQIGDTLLGVVPAGEPQRHLYAQVRDFIGRSGKGLRPAITLATAGALGGKMDGAIPAAAGLEMLHNAFLVHDDIEDESDVRRGVPTMHKRIGVPLAVNAGDTMNALAMRLFRQSGERVGPAATLRILDEVDHLLIESLEGQAMELGWMRDNDLTVGADDYLRLVLKKTAWYSFIHPMRIGAIVANPEDQELARFDRFGFLLGLAFQITDDVLNLDGDLGTYGKEIDGDLWEGKRTLILSHGLAHAEPRHREWIAQFLARPRARRLPREVLMLHDILEGSGSIAWARAAAASLAKAAEAEFGGRAFAGVADSADLAWLRECVAYLVHRQR